MAIQKETIIDRFGITLPETYCKIDSVHINRDQTVTFSINVYSDAAARDANAQPLHEDHEVVKLSDLNVYEGNDILAKLYAFAKDKMPAYKSGTTDV
jgi:uncharacterized protein YbaA (DUF1428 family)